MSSQAEIVRAFRQGSVPEEKCAPAYIETVMSHVFLFPERVYKLYKDDSTFFNTNFSNLGDITTRLNFIRSDFAWNQAVTPEIYSDLKSVKLKDGKLSFSVDDSETEHLVIIMNRVDTARGLLPLLLAGALKEDDYFQIGYQLAGRLSKIQTQKAASDLTANFKGRLEDLRPWITGLSTHLPQEEALEYVDFLSTFYEHHEAIMAGRENVAVCSDVHSENMLYIDDVLLPIDTNPPKEEWKVGHKDFDLYRLATDIYAFSGKQSFDMVLKGYVAATGRELDTRLTSFFVIYAASIMVPYLYFLGEKSAMHLEAAGRYRAFLRDYFKACKEDA